MGNQDAQQSSSENGLEGGNYEVLRGRLQRHGRELASAVEALNSDRQRVFGGSELEVVANERVRTENNCVPRDIVSVGEFLFFGYNVFIGLKSETSIEDVFALHRFSPQPEGGFDCSPVSLESANGFLLDEGFQKEFANTYRYTRDARLLQLVKSESHVLATFQIGGTHNDIKVFKWNILADGSLHYAGDRGIDDYVLPPAFDFEWTALGRSDQVTGRHPHYNVCDTLFVDNTGGSLTIKIENNTETGEGIFEEKVEDSNQTLDDAQWAYAKLGSLILLRILPYRESVERFIVVNSRTHQVSRIDSIGEACLQLPEDQGILFPNGFYLQTGRYKTFAGDSKGLLFEKVIRSPNGEDILYVFHRREDGHYVLFPYNVIRKEVQTPIECHGYSLFADGRLVVFRSLGDEPTRVHPMQVWQTPFTSAEFAASAPTGDSFLAKVGNAELVRGISDAFSLCRLISEQEPTRYTFEDIISTSRRALDAYYWLDHQEVGNLKQYIAQISTAVESIIDEFEKVLAQQGEAKTSLAEAEELVESLGREVRAEHWDEISLFMEGLTTLRTQRGHLIGLKDMRYANLDRLSELEEKIVAQFDVVSQHCVSFLLREEALAPLKVELSAILEDLAQVTKVAEVDELLEKVAKTSSGLDLLSEVATNLQIDDTTQRTAVLESITDTFAQVNRVRAEVEGTRRDLRSKESKAEFAAQFKLLGQTVSSALVLCDTPERCDDELSRVMISVEELEAHFAEFDEFLEDLAKKREDVYEAFSTKRQQLMDARQRKAQNLVSAATRILGGIARRARSLASADEINSYYASDAMALKVRQLCEQLSEIGDASSGEELLSKLKSSKQDAMRALRDKEDLFEEGDHVIKLGEHRFSVNTTATELNLVPRGEDVALHIGGTDFYEIVQDSDFLATREFWKQELVSENEEVYRGEYLAATILFAAEENREGQSLSKLQEAMREQRLGALVSAVAQERYEDGYERGIHDSDASLILAKVLAMREVAGLLRYPAVERSLAMDLWCGALDEATKKRWLVMARSLAKVREYYSDDSAFADLEAEIATTLCQQPQAREADVDVTAEYLSLELAQPDLRFVVSARAQEVIQTLLADLGHRGLQSSFDEDLRALREDRTSLKQTMRGWVSAFVATQMPEYSDSITEAVGLLCHPEESRSVSSAITHASVDGLLGQHRRIQDRALLLRLDEFNLRLRGYIQCRVQEYRNYRKKRSELTARGKERLRLGELVPKVMSSFVRNKLINEVYLPLIGANLAKQIGATGVNKRTDLMGLLLLISPPGYGKTTLMEYVANRLGLIFVKVNGPALGHKVTSLDPEEAPNATARQEVIKINLALEMASNVMLYIDDIQHTHTELLQKFVSLCDAQRRIEGVWNGRTQTYDLRGKKFCIVMAGNPYTESGEKFQIPDMLSNRADIYNLGDVLSGREEAFSLSYIENSLTSNATLAPLASRDMADVYTLVRMARGEPTPASALKHSYSASQLSDILSVLKHVLRCQDVLLQVNQQYILSAAQEDAFRSEPPFKLQGSYRNMNKLSEKIVSAMSDQEVEELIDDHYIGESQTLTTEAEQNLLKLAEMRGRQTPEQKERWHEIKEEFVRRLRVGGAEDDPAIRIVGAISHIGSEIGKLVGVVEEASADKPQIEILD